MMRKISGLIAAVLLLAVPVAAQAGFTMGARIGLAKPGGELADGWDVADDVDMAVPIMFHMGGAFAQNHASIEGFLEVSPMSLSSDTEGWCDDYALSCGAVGLRFGVMGTFRLMPEAPMTPWFGAGLGYEMLFLDIDVATYAFTGTSLELMGGLDFKAGRVFSVGPFLSLQFGTYSEVTYDIDGYGDGTEDPDAGMHTWIQLGIRGKFDFGGGGGGGYAPGPGY